MGFLAGKRFRPLEELLRFIYAIYFLFSYAYMHYTWNGKHPFLEKSEFKYTLHGMKKSATIYRSKKLAPKRVILFLSGAYNLENHAYIAKTMHDLELKHGSILQEYELICFEKSDQSSIIIYDDVAHYIKHLSDSMGIEELILFGYSAGGCVAAHVMSRLKSFEFNKRIITYDTPWQVQDNVEYFQGYWLYRPDLLFYIKVHHTYSTHYNYDDIKQHLVAEGSLNGARELVEIIRNVHNYSPADMYEVTGFNFDQTADTKVYNIMTRWDPFVVRHGVHDKFVRQNADKIHFPNKVIEKSCIGHCSDMGFSTEYLNEVMFAIRDN